MNDCPYCKADDKVTAWQNFRWDVYDWAVTDGVIFAVAVSVIFFLLVLVT